MATTRIFPLHTGKGRSFGRAISDIIDYAENLEKTDSGQLITSFACESCCVDAEILFAKRKYIQKTGRVRGKDDVIAYQVQQSFVLGEITAEEDNRIGVEFAKRFTKENHAFVVCTHINKAHIHNISSGQLSIWTVTENSVTFGTAPELSKGSVIPSASRTVYPL